MKTIASLNDEFRAAGPVRGSGRWMITQGVEALGETSVADVIRAVRYFTRFTSDNDPHDEHDFGAFTLAGERLFWKIDCYDLTLECGSPNPADETVTCRVMTIMLASEY